MRNVRVRVTAALALALLGFAVPVRAHPDFGLPSGGGDGSGGSHPTTPRHRLDEAGFHGLDNKGFNTDIQPWVSRNGGLYAATGTWGTALAPGDGCPSETDNPGDPSSSGVWIVDATTPEKPEVVSKLGTIPGSQNNDVKVERLPVEVDGKAARRDLLVHSLEPCGIEGLLHQLPGSPWIDLATRIQQAAGLDQTGFQVYDVTDPAKPVRLGTWNNGGIGTHNLFLFDQGNRSFVAAVFNQVDQFELTQRLIEGSVQIVEITDPNNPTLVGEWSLHDVTDTEGNSLEPELCRPRGFDSAFCYNHDVWASADGRLLYNAWWDAGLVVLDVSDPAKPKFLGQGQQQLQADDPQGWLNEEGNTHSLVPTEVDGRHVVVVGDEDFSGGLQDGVRVNGPAEIAGFTPGAHWSGTADLDGQTADLVYAGTGCTAANYADVDAEGKIVIVDDNVSADDADDTCGPYLFKQKMDAAEAAGAIALVQVARDDEAGGANAIDSGIPGMEISLGTGAPIRDAVIDGEKVNATLTTGGLDPWGFMRVVDIGPAGQVADATEWREVAQFKAPHVEDSRPGEEDVFSGHNPVLGPDGRIYYSWYTNGVRVLELAQGGAQVEEVAWFVPLPRDHEDDNDEDPHGVQEANTGFWGSWPVCHPKTGELLVFNSDLNRGIYVLRAVPDLSARACAPHPAR